MAQRTPLYAIHVSSGAKMVDFAGWMMPVQFKGIIHEHNTVRNKAGAFDIGHMGQIEVFKGEELQKLTTNDIYALKEGMGQYSFICGKDGTVIDDLIIYRLEDRFLVISNAVNAQKVFAIIKGKDPGAKMLYDSRVAIAVQGPLALDIAGKILSYDLKIMKHRQIIPVTISGNYRGLVSRSGYSGEDGVEIFFDKEAAEILWGDIIEQGALPCGLGSRDTLRIEAGLPLYGHEISPEDTPLDAGFDRFVKLEKGDFVGKTSLISKKESGEFKRLIGFNLDGRAVPRQGHELFGDKGKIGYVTSGTFSPTLDRPIGMAYLYPGTQSGNGPVKVQIRDNMFEVSLRPLPFYKRARL